MKNKNKTGIDTLIVCKALRTISEKHLSEPTLQLILDIIRDIKTMENEPYYQALSEITDILNSSKTEQEIIKKLNEIFPK